MRQRDGTMLRRDSKHNAYTHPLPPPLWSRYNAKLDAVRQELETQYEQRFHQLRAHEDALQVS